jgi:hypothetical protein
LLAEAVGHAILSSFIAEEHRDSAKKLFAKPRARRNDHECSSIGIELDGLPFNEHESAESSVRGRLQR